MQLAMYEPGDNKIQGIIRNLVRKEGIRAFWKGNLPAEILYVLYGGTQFTSYSIFSNILTEIDNDGHLRVNSSTHSLLAGGFAGLTSTLVTYPFDLLRTQLSANTASEFVSMIHTIKNIYAQDALYGFFRGIQPTLLSITISTGLMFWSYELTREAFTKLRYNVPFVEGICGFIAGISSKALTFPLDTIKKRMQVKSNSNRGESQGGRAINIMKHIKLREGFKGFYRGFGLSLLKSGPTNAFSLLIYEYALNGVKSVRNFRLI